MLDNIFRTPISMRGLVEMAKLKKVNYSYCVYVKDSDAPITADTVCFIEDYPEINDSDEEIYPEFVVDNNLELLCREELLQDVVRNAIHQKPNVATDEIVNAFNYYNEHDSFLKIQ